MKQIFLSLVLLVYVQAADENFYRDANGVTIHCENAAVGETGTVYGISYTKINSISSLLVNGGLIDATVACTSGITSMYRWFYGESTFNKIIAHWDTGSVTDMSYMFYAAFAFNQDIGNWDTGSVTDMGYMFESARAFNQDIGNWYTGSVTDMTHMFTSASAFDQNLSQWCVSEISSEPSLFDGGSAFENQSAKQPQWGECPFVFTKQNNGIVVCSQAPIGSSFELDGILYIKIEDRYDLIVFNGTIDATQVCTTGIIDMQGWFAGVTDFNKDISHWDTGSVTDMSYMFTDSTSFNQDLSQWCASEIPVKPTDFDTGAGFESIITKQPQWGECPTEAPSSINLAPVYYLLLN